MHAPLRHVSMAAALLGLGWQSLTPASAQDDDGDAGPERCISLMSLDRTEVIDDRTIIFHMRAGDIYLNHLARECPGLKREERFMYAPTSNRLCDVDTVTVLEQWGFGLTRGFTCALGMFHPITDAELADLRVTAEGGGGSGEGGFEVVPVEPRGDEGEGDDGEAAPEEGADGESGARTDVGAESGARTDADAENADNDAGN